MSFKILIADDNFINRKVLMKLLEKYAHFDVVVNGKEALEAVKLSYMEETPYDLILLDIIMPEMNGQETLLAIREFEQEHNILTLDGVKVIMVTALSDSKNIMKAFRGGCESYIVKPVTKEALFSEMRKLGLEITPIS